MSSAGEYGGYHSLPKPASSHLYQTTAFPVSEDCLTINVLRPSNVSQNAELLPVVSDFSSSFIRVADIRLVACLGVRSNSSFQNTVYELLLAAMVVVSKKEQPWNTTGVLL
jgi:hypothetical protein